MPSAYPQPSPNLRPRSKPNVGRYDVACVIHLHSAFSDGTGTIEEIAAAARRAGADVVMVTDHDTLGARRAGHERWWDDVLVLVGVELSSDEGHLLAFGLEEEIDHAGLSAGELTRRVTETGALAFAAHPFSHGSRISKTIGRPHGWPDFAAPGLTGIELWSLETDELEAAASPRELWRFLRAPDHAYGPPAAHLRAWDALCARRPLVGIGGLDAHQKGIRIRGRAFGLIGYERVFRILRTHLLLDEPLGADVRGARGAVYAALREGRCYLAVDAIAPASGFVFWADDAAGRPIDMGATTTEAVGLHVRVPRPATLAVLRDGAELARRDGTSLDCEVEGPGVYRTEAHVDGRTWIVSNPIYVR